MTEVHKSKHPNLYFSSNPSRSIAAHEHPNPISSILYLSRTLFSRVNRHTPTHLRATSTPSPEPARGNLEPQRRREGLELLPDTERAGEGLPSRAAGACGRAKTQAGNASSCPPLRFLVRGARSISNTCPFPPRGCMRVIESYCSLFSLFLFCLLKC
jgi:hypothetical protein